MHTPNSTSQPHGPIGGLYVSGCDGKQLKFHSNSPSSTVVSDRHLFFTISSYCKMVANAAIMPKLLLATKIAIILALAISQFIFFGMPAWEKYSSALVGEAKLVEKRDSLRSPVDPLGPLEDGLKPPAITLCPFKYNFRGWKQTNIQDNASTIQKLVNDQSYNRWCEFANSTADFEKCIEEGTFGLNDTVIQAWAAWENVTGPEFWTSDVTLSLSGRCYTLDLDIKLGVHKLMEQILLKLNPNLTYTIFFHQLDIYYSAINPVALAEAGVQRMLSVDDIGNQYLRFTFELIRRERLNRPESPCNPDIGYKFSQCIKQSVSDAIGCKLPWDEHSEGSFFIGPKSDHWLPVSLTNSLPN